MSEEAKEANLAYLNVLWDSWKEVVGSNRKITTEEIQFFVDNADKIFTETDNSMAEVFQNYGLVDMLLPRTKIRELLKENSPDLLIKFPWKIGNNFWYSF